MPTIVLLSESLRFLCKSPSTSARLSLYCHSPSSQFSKRGASQWSAKNRLPTYSVWSFR